MQSKAITVDQYIEEIPEDRKQAVTELRKVIKKIFQRASRNA
jgi:hypothetical protein